MNGWKWSLLAVSLAGALVAGPMLGHDAFARKKKEVLKASINGKRFKANLKPSIVGAYNDVSKILTVNGLYQKIRPGRGSIKTLTFSINIDLATATFPVTLPGFAAIYSDNTFKGLVPGTPTTWAGDGMNVTLKSFKNSQIVGTFEGSLDPGAGNATTPATVTKGKLKVNVQ